MTAVRFYRLKCDAPACRCQFSSNEDRADVTRGLAAPHGWVHGVVPPAPHKGGPAKSLDYCPEHAELLGVLAPKTLPVHARPT